MILSAALLAAAPVRAQEASGLSKWVTGNVSLTTDYSLRGISQTLVSQRCRAASTWCTLPASTWTHGLRA